MECRSVRESFSDYFDGVLPGAERKSVGEHLKACPSCRAEYRKFSLTVSAVAGLPEVPAPPNFVYFVQERLAQERESWWRRAASRVNAGLEAVPLRALTAAAAAVLVVTVLLFSHDDHISQPVARVLSHPGDNAVPASLVGATDPVPVEFASTNPSLPSALPSGVSLETPTSFLLEVIKNDPYWSQFAVYPHHRGTGVIIVTPERVLEVEMDPAEFPIIQAYVEQQGVPVPRTLREARTLYPIYVRVLPSPTRPLSPGP